MGNARAGRAVDVSGEAGVGVFDRADAPLGVPPRHRGTS